MSKSVFEVLNLGYPYYNEADQKEIATKMLTENSAVTENHFIKNLD